MTDRPTDTVLVLGKALALILRGACAIAGVVVLLLVPFALLVSQDMLPGLVALREMPIIAASPLSVVGLLLMLAAILAVLFSFFGKLRTVIESVGAGDPFIPANARRLEAMAWLLLGAKVLAVAVGLLRLHVANLVEDAPQTLDFSLYDLDGVLLIVILFILARVFRRGADMRADLEGTV